MAPICHAASWALLLAAVRPRRAVADLAVLAIGDWGGESEEEPTTESQRLTALGMQRRALELNTEFTMLMGDNFYQHGVAGDELSSRFSSTFEEVYATLLPEQPFYAFAGNHDYGEGNIANISAQVAYTQRSAQWRFPSLWYTIRRDFDTVAGPRSLDIIALDTVVLCGNGPENEGFINEELRFVGGGYGAGGGRNLREAVAEAQWAWLERELAESRADYLWAAGHYPIWSAGTDGSQRCLIDRLLPLLAAHGAHYISGHDHMLEHFKHGGVNSFVVGAGKECCYPPENMHQVPPGDMRYMLAGVSGSLSQPAAPFPVFGGFASIHFGAEVATVALYAHDGTELYVAPPIPRRGAWVTTEAGWLRHRGLVMVVGFALALSLFMVRIVLARWTFGQSSGARGSGSGRPCFGSPLLAGDVSRVTVTP